MKHELVLLGIDGAGKSTMSNYIKIYLQQEGFNPYIVPFHKWVFADKLRSAFGKVVDKGRKDRTSPYIPKKNSLAAFVKPPVAFMDNVMFYLTKKPKNNNDFAIFDRFICATQIKFNACNYRTDWFKSLWWGFKPKNAIVFLIDESESVERQKQRNDIYAWGEQQLSIERELYIKFATQHGFPIINTSGKTPEETFKEVKTIVDKVIGKES